MGRGFLLVQTIYINFIYILYIILVNVNYCKRMSNNAKQLLITINSFNQNYTPFKKIKVPKLNFDE